MPTPDAILQSLPGETHIARGAAHLHDDLASLFMAGVVKAVELRGVCHVALSGGNTPEPFYTGLVIDPRYRGIPWSNVHLWQVDERRVPADDVRSNLRVLRESLADHVPLRRRQLHAMPVLRDDAADIYERELLEVIDQVPAARSADAPPRLPPRLDFVLLGMGADGHTASLFPHSPALQEKRQLVTANDGPTVTPPPRLTMTFPLLNAARRVVVLVTGATKTAMLSRVARQWRDAGPDVQALPITGIDPQDGELLWFLDPAAAGDA